MPEVVEEDVTPGAASPVAVAPVVVPCKTVEELWTLLDPMQPLGDLVRNPHDLVFRGQGDAAWGLEPSVTRAGGGLSPAQRVWKLDGLTSDQQVAAEWSLLRLFVEACDLSALPLPVDSADFRKRWFHTNAKGLNDITRRPETWPPEELHDILALAQHHGMPTRLVDWTRRGHVAAYFAAEGGIQHECGEVAVWVLDLERRGLFREVEIVRVPGATSLNLAAQQGLFTLVRGTGGRGQAHADLRVEDVITAKFAHNPKACPLWKLTLPRSEAPKLLDRCSKFGISAASLFPGYEGAAKSALLKVLG